MVLRREASEPISYIIGSKEFWSLDFQVSKDTLIPRPDTETIIESAQALFKREHPSNILDIGTGSGCVILSLLHQFKSSKGVGVDVSEGALDVARSNAQRLGVADRAEFVQSSWLDRLHAAHSTCPPFSLIVSNPPYIPDADIDGLAHDVALYEPRLALSGGPDGLGAYRSIHCALGSRRGMLCPGGYLLLEIGHGQEHDVTRIIEGDHSGLEYVCTTKDIQGISRCLIFRNNV